MTEGYEIRLSASAARALEVDSPEGVATAAWQFIDGPLRENPSRLGQQSRPPLYPLYSARRGEYRILYRLQDRLLLLDVVRLVHRRDAYRPS